jgi:hypothetical protein
VADDIAPEDIEWQRNRRVPVEASVLAVGYEDEGEPIRHALPAQPPVTLDEVMSCSKDDVARFTQKLDFFRLVLGARDAPREELLAASVRLAAATHGDPEFFTRQCGRELARLLANDGARLDDVLRRLT